MRSSKYRKYAFIASTASAPGSRNRFLRTASGPAPERRIPIQLHLRRCANVGGAEPTTCRKLARHGRAHRRTALLRDDGQERPGYGLRASKPDGPVVLDLPDGADVHLVQRQSLRGKAPLIQRRQVPCPRLLERREQLIERVSLIFLEHGRPVERVEGTALAFLENDAGARDPVGLF